ncbi:hypothetical protein CRUP_003183 [Coryphaenoides rupestris]|nr:hypothetical protein CRUP_003183 [Coryphaenoides rupestris]
MQVRRQLMGVNRALCLEYPQLQVPWFHAHYCQQVPWQGSGLERLLSLTVPFARRRSDLPRFGAGAVFAAGELVPVLRRVHCWARGGRLPCPVVPLPGQRADGRRAPARGPAAPSAFAPPRRFPPHQAAMDASPSPPRYLFFIRCRNCKTGTRQAGSNPAGGQDKGKAGRLGREAARQAGLAARAGGRAASERRETGVGRQRRERVITQETQKH